MDYLAVFNVIIIAPYSCVWIKIYYFVLIIKKTYEPNIKIRAQKEIIDQGIFAEPTAKGKTDEDIVG